MDQWPRCPSSPSNSCATSLSEGWTIRSSPTVHTPSSWRCVKQASGPASPCSWIWGPPGGCRAWAASLLRWRPRRSSSDGSCCSLRSRQACCAFQVCGVLASSFTCAVSMHERHSQAANAADSPGNWICGSVHAPVAQGKACLDLCVAVRHADACTVQVQCQAWADTCSGADQEARQLLHVASMDSGRLCDSTSCKLVSYVKVAAMDRMSRMQRHLNSRQWVSSQD